jgi:hypothetical protein
VSHIDAEFAGSHFACTYLALNRTLTVAVYLDCSSVRARERALAAAAKEECDAEEEHYGRIPDRPVSCTTFEERRFGDLGARDCVPRDFPCSVVSLALFDGLCFYMLMNFSYLLFLVIT